MKLSFGVMLAIVWLAAITMVCIGHRGHGEQRGVGQSTYAIKRYVRQLQGCLRDVRQQKKISDDKVMVLESQNQALEAEIEACNTENEALREEKEACDIEKEACNTENEALQEEIDDLEEAAKCCK